MKRVISILLSVVMTAAVIGTLALAQGNVTVKGDVNGDGELDNKDVVALFRYVSGGEKIEDESAYDINGDGGVDNKDVTALFRELSGGETGGKTIYDILLYSTGEGDKFQGMTARYTGKEFFGFAEKSKKTGMNKKTVEMFGSEYSASYVDTQDFGIYDERYDKFIGGGGLFTFGEDTGRLTMYAFISRKEGNEFTPPVNAHSDRQDFIDYARYAVLEYTGISTDDCDVEVRTLSLKTKYKYTKEELEQSFVNFIDQDPDFTAEYEIIFRRKLNGVYRADDISVQIRNDGEILYLYSRTCDNKYTPFLDVEIDSEGLTKAVENCFALDVGEVTHTILLRTVPDGDELWVLADVNYKYDDGSETFGGVIQYITKIA